MPTALPRLALAVVFLAACGKGGNKNSAKRDDAALSPVAAPIALPDLGVERIGKFNFIYDSGRAAYDKAAAAAKKEDWAEVKKQAEAALAKDADHLDAHRLLAVALAQQGEHAAAVDHLVTAIASDYHGYAAEYATDPLLEGFRATQHGQAMTLLASQIGDEYAKRVASGLWFVGRRSSFRFSKASGEQTLTSRGELYAFDRDTKRYLRLTHTGHQVAGYVRSAAGTEVAVIGFDKADRPKDGAPLIARAWLRTYDATTWQPTMDKVRFGPGRAIAVHYGAGDQLLVGHAPAADRWALGDWSVAAVDRTTAKLTTVGTPLGAPRVELTLDEGRVVLASDAGAVKAAWSGDPARAPALTIGTTKIAVPESGQAALETVAVAPDAARVAFATAVDPCAKDTAPSLYVADAKSGALKHLLTEQSRFSTRWLDANTLAYEDGGSAIQLWDAATGREALRIENKAGVALNVLSMASAPLCKQAPPTAEPTGSADEMPPEEDSSGPVTTPQ